MTEDCYIGFDAIIVPNVPDLKQRGPEARDNYCDKVDVMQAQLVTDTDTGLAPIAESCPTTGGGGADSGQGRGQGQGQSVGRHQHHSWTCRSTIF